MGFTLDDIVPWGRSYAEYLAMFALGKNEREWHVLGCGDGPASFNAGFTQNGGKAVSLDPLYAFEAGQIEKRISETCSIVLQQLRQNQEDYVWHTIPSVEALGQIRMDAMNAFLLDFESGKRQGRYVAGALPSLPFQAGQFDLALASHLLFLYSHHLSRAFHLQALTEMLRVAREVRVFPLLALDGQLSPHLFPVIEHFGQSGFSVSIQRVPYEFQRGGNEMLLIAHQDTSCHVGGQEG